MHNDKDTKTMRRITILQTREIFDCSSSQSLLAGMARLGRRGIPVGCLGGGCGVCKIRVRSGDVEKLGPVSRAHVTVDEEAEGYTLACRVAPRADIEIEVAGLFKKPFFKGCTPGVPPVSGS